MASKRTENILGAYGKRWTKFDIANILQNNQG